jgi:DNA ligase-1
MTRKKKDVDESSLKVQVCLFVFDMIYLNGESLIDKSFRTRRQLMQDNIPVVKGQLDYAQGMDCDDTEEIQKFLEQSVERKIKFSPLFWFLIYSWL